MRDYLNILQTHGYYDENNWNRTDSIYTFPETNSKIEFFAADEASKLRGGRRDDLWINEANNVSFNAFNELEIRTRDTIWLDWNPVSVFWWDEEVEPHYDVDKVKLTYRDNEALEQSIVQSIEARKYTNPAWYNVYGLGNQGTLEGLIYQSWQLIDYIPEEAELIRRGLDFGYTNDPTALVAIYKYQGGFIIDEELYATGLSNKQIAEVIKSTDNQCLVVADSAEPKSIDEISSYDVRITGSQKGQGSVMQGIQLVQDQKLYYTKRSTNLIKEARNYQWKIDKRTGKPLNVPEHVFSHGKDAERYAIVDLLGQKEVLLAM